MGTRKTDLMDYKAAIFEALDAEQANINEYVVKENRELELYYRGRFQVLYFLAMKLGIVGEYIERRADNVTK